MTGNYRGEQRTFQFTFALDKATTRNAFVPRLWAGRRIAYLADQARQRMGQPESGVNTEQGEVGRELRLFAGYAEVGHEREAQSPADGTVFTADSAFVMNWTLQNTSSTAWDMKEADLMFLGAQNGVRLHQGGDVYDLTSTVNPGDTYDVTLDAIAPSSPGNYGEAWGIVVGKSTLCPFWLLIQVK